MLAYNQSGSVRPTDVQAVSRSDAIITGRETVTIFPDNGIDWQFRDESVQALQLK
jgi:hypothetical protein